MTTGPLLKISVFTLIEAEEAVSALVERVLGQTPVLYTDDETLITQVSVYCARASAWTPAKRQKIVSGLAQLRTHGLPVGRTRITTQKLREQDWAESWKRHFKPLEVGNALLVKPSWSRRQPRRGQALIVLDPGLSFGTGQHPTTGFCLEQVVACRTPKGSKSMLDVGTGSGILAIAAAKLGFGPIRAFDFDPVAIRVARENAVRNGVDRQIRFSQKDLTRMPVETSERYDLVCANLLDDLLVREAARLSNRVCRRGRLVVAGILSKQFARVCEAFRTVGLKLLIEKTDSIWQSGTFAWLDDG